MKPATSSAVLNSFDRTWAPCYVGKGVPQNFEEAVKLAELAQAQNPRGIKTNRGCQFRPTTVHRLLKAA